VNRGCVRADQAVGNLLGSVPDAYSPGIDVKGTMRKNTVLRSLGLCSEEDTALNRCERTTEPSERCSSSVYGAVGLVSRCWISMNFAYLRALISPGASGGGSNGGRIAGRMNRALDNQDVTRRGPSAHVPSPGPTRPITEIIEQVVPGVVRDPLRSQ